MYGYVLFYTHQNFIPVYEVEEESAVEEATLSEEEELAFEADQINNLAEELHGLEIMVKNFGIDFVMPFIMYDYINADRRYVTCDYLVLTLNKDNFPRGFLRMGRSC